MKLTHSCKKAAELLSQRIDQPLGLFDNLRLRVHLSMCGNCQNVANQMEDLHTLSADLFSEGLTLDESPAHPSAPQLESKR